MKRVNSIDFTRGLVMIFMALDHVRDFLHVSSITQSPTDLSTTTPMLFFTRWITYLCAPIFVFLAGTSAYLSCRSKGNISQSRRLMIKRGAWLILLEFTLVNFGLFFDPGFHTFIFEVIAAIGFGFIILGFMLNVSSVTIGVIGLFILLCHNLLPFIPFAPGSVVKTILSPMFAPGAFPVTAKLNFIMAYPPVPWLGIMLLGFASGYIFELPAERRKNWLIKSGSVALPLFMVIRYIDVYGDPLPWTSQKNLLTTCLSFFNVTKYPPSLLFCLITLGIMFFLLALAETAKSRLMEMVCIYGKVPLFYFLVHFYLIHLIMIAVMFIQCFNWKEMDFASGNFGRPAGVVSGTSLGIIYVIWIAVVLVLYKPCLWYGTYKLGHRNWWLKYV